VAAVPRAELERRQAEAQLRQAVRDQVAAVYPGASPGLRALLADHLAAGLLEPGPLAVLTGL
jgi:hypothetical protein